jgi:hypothetical protein
LAADYEIKQISISVVDQDHSSYSQKLVHKLTASGYFQLVEYGALVTNKPENGKQWQYRHHFNHSATF